MGFQLKGHIPAIVKGQDPSVVHKCGAHPGPGDLFRRAAQVGFEQPVNHLSLTIRTGVIHAGFERLMNAVLAPGLGQHLQFNVKWVASFPNKIRLDRLHFLQAERQAAIRAEGRKFLRGGCAQGDHIHPVAGGFFGHKGRGQGLVHRVALDHGVRKNRVRQAVQVFGGKCPIQQKALAGRHVQQPADSEPVRGSLQVLRHRVGDAGQQCDFNGVFGGQAGGCA